MNDLQVVQLNLLKEFDSVCRKYNLKYFLIGGSCLGAVRHKGFIPWDDDIDVGMPRDDYEKFCELQKEFDQKNYFIQTYKTDPKYMYNFAKLRDSNTTYIENVFKNIQFNHGVWIDIFPLDGFSNKQKGDKYFKKELQRAWRQVVLIYPWNMRRKFSRKTFFKDLFINLGAILCFWTNIKQYRNKALDKHLKKYSYATSDYVGNHYGIYKEKESVPKEWYGDGKEVMFEDLKVFIPYEYDKFLTRLYNDYMTPPPENKCVGHHYHSGCSLSQSYIDYIKEHKI